MYRLAGDVISGVYALGADMAVLAVNGRSGCEGRVAGAGGREAVDGGRDFGDAADGVLQLAQRLFGLLEFCADALPVLSSSACIARRQ